jgi:two-component system, HptB-dependent secretion and biofilm response regulator
MPMKWFLDKTFSNDEAEVLKTIASTANEGIWIIDINGDTLFVNEKMADSLGYDVKSFGKLNIYDFLCDNGSIDVQKPHILADRHEICLKHKDGSARVFSINTSAFFGSSGEYVGSLGMLSDITDVKTSASELKHQKEILETVVEAVNYLFSEHDILSALERVVYTIGSRLGTDRCFVYGRGLTQSYIETKMLQLAAYECKNIHSASQNYDCFEFVNSEECFGGVENAIRQHGYFESDETNINTQPMVSVKACGIGYMLIFPLFVQNELWGIFGLGCGNSKSTMDDAQRVALETMGKNIAFAVEKFFVTRQLDNTKMELLCINQNLEAAAARAIDEKLKIEQEKIQKERELFSVKEKYHLLQQDDAYNKQIKILRDDLSHKSEGGFLFESFYKPLDILSGDIYGLIKVSKKSSFIYIVDAMGKGLSASVTAVVSASFINDLADNAAKKGSFELRSIVESYQAFIKKQINEDEIVCAVFVYIDDAEGVLEVANFSMPEILYIENGEVKTIKANNYPIAQYFDGVKIEKISASSIERLLISSDGLKDARLEVGGVYKESMYQDFASSQTKNIFLKKLFSKALNPEDDLTFAFISRYEPQTLKSVEFELLPNIEAIVECVDEKLRGHLSEYFDSKTLMQMECALNEMLMNAVEHGTLKISYNQKHLLLESHIYEEYLEEAIQKMGGAENKKIKLCFEEILLKNRKAVIIKVKDSGDGFDVGSTLKALSLNKNMRFNGRGILMSDNVLDALFYNENGNEANMIKLL